jgi:hypothetical protein
MPRGKLLSGTHDFLKEIKISMTPLNQATSDSSNLFVLTEE